VFDRKNMRLALRVAIILIACFLSTLPSAAEPLPRTVLVLHQSIPFTEYFSKLFASFQSTLKAGSTIPITIYSESLGHRHFKGADYDSLVYEFIKEKYRSRALSAIVADGFDALQFALSLRSELENPSLPIVFSGVDDSSAAEFPPNVTGMTLQGRTRDVLITARALVPGLRRIAVVGDPLEEQPYRRHHKKELQSIDKGVELVDLTGLPMNELLWRVATLPDDAAIFYTSLSGGPNGANYEPNDALALIAKAASRPIVIDQETRLGHGGTGGFLLQAAPAGEATARILLRLFNGESVSTIPVTANAFVRPTFDWRELRRWNINEAGLPAGSEIRFREYSAWEQYRRYILLFCAALVLQTALIGWLIYEIRRRQSAEIQSRSAMAELTFMNRRVAAGQLSASLTHEFSQPLSGIVTRASAALRWIRAEKPNLERAEAALEGIVAAGHRASDIITSVRAMFKKDAPQKTLADINQVIRTVLSIVHVELQNHGVELHTRFDEHLPAVQGDKVQLQQVVLNLVMNAIESMHSVQPRVLTIQTGQTGAGLVHVSIEDTGTGIDPSNLQRIFKPLFTTKANGMGMGLSICHSIIESHDGRIWVSPAVNRGSIFQFELPVDPALEHAPEKWQPVFGTDDAQTKS
jgi:signal transduction histidine kinase